MSGKKKILFILHVPPPVHGSSIVGGFIRNSTLINSGFNARYINLGTSNSIDEIGKNGLSKIVVYLRIIFKVIRQLITFKPNLVYIAMTAKGVGFYKDMVMALLAKAFGVQLVIHFHNKGVRDNQHRILDHRLYKLVFKNSKIILLSKYLYPDIKMFVGKQNVFYCPNGIPEIEARKPYADTKPQAVKLLFLSNLIKTKGVYELLDAIKLLKSKKLQFFCSFVGGIGDISEAEFNARVKSLDLIDSVSYLGKKLNEDKSSIFGQSDIFVHPSFSDCFPLVLLEASQFKLPLLSTFEGAIPEIVDDGITGFLVPVKDSRAIAEKLEILISDHKLRTDMGTSAYTKYKNNYTLAIFEKNMCSILQTITQTSK